MFWGDTSGAVVPPAGAESWSPALAACDRFPAVSPDTVSAALPHCDWSSSPLLCCLKRGKRRAGVQTHINAVRGVDIRAWWRHEREPRDNMMSSLSCLRWCSWDIQHQTTYSRDWVSCPARAFIVMAYAANMDSHMSDVVTVWKWWKAWYSKVSK